MHFVYIIKSLSTGKYYCGETANLEDRLKRHNQGRSKYTKSGVPWILVKSILVEDRSKARGLELKIKKRGISRFLES